MPAQTDLMQVDWSRLPAPADDGAARHLEGASIPDIALTATNGATVSLPTLPGRTVIYAYPRTAIPGKPMPDGWDGIPGARGCTPQSCAFRDQYAGLKAAGVSGVFGLSTQSTGDQREAAERLHLPFPLLSDAGLLLTNAMRLPAMIVEGETLLKRFALIVDDARITKVFYPVFPPDRNASDVQAWLEANPG
jgi:peroxiredoxin